MAISDAEFQLWLAADGKTRVLLVEAEAYSGGAVVTRYLSHGGYVSGPADTPANTCYEDAVVATPVFESHLTELYEGLSLPAWGDIEIDNASGDRDSWLNDAWAGRPLRLYVGDPSWPRADFRPVLVGITRSLEVLSRDTLALTIADRAALLDVPAQTSLIGGSTANANETVPQCFGPCFNIEPVLIDASTHTYQVHDGAINAISAVRDSGVAAAYTPNLAAGTFTLASPPTGRVTADVEGAKPAGTYLTTAADIIEHLVTTRSTLTGSDIDASNFAAFNATCPQILNLYVRERRNLMELIDEIVMSVGGWWTFSRAGLLQLGRLEAPGGSPALSLVADDVDEDGLTIARREPVLATVRLGYARNWTIQPDGLAGSVGEADRALYAAEHQVAVATDASIKTAHPLAGEPDVIPTLLADATEAATEAARRLALRALERTVYRLKGWTAPLTLALGQEIDVQHPRFGLDDGAAAIVIGLSEDVTREATTLEVWR